MLTKLRLLKSNFFLTTLIVASGLTVNAFATSSSDTSEIKLKWLKTNLKERPYASKLIVLGPRANGKSTLINLLIHTSEYATRSTSGAVLLDPEDQVNVLYHTDVFRADHC